MFEVREAIPVKELLFQTETWMVGMKMNVLKSHLLNTTV